MINGITEDEANNISNFIEQCDSVIPAHSRNSGYYWVKYNDKWLIVYFFHKIHQIDGGKVHHQYWWEMNDCAGVDEDFNEIDEKMLVRSEK